MRTALRIGKTHYWYVLPADTFVSTGSATPGPSGSVPIGGQALGSTLANHRVMILRGAQFKASVMLYDDTKALEAQIKELRMEHQDLHDVIARLSQDVYGDQLQLKRLKKRKLQLKDHIERLRSKLIPDMDA